MGCVHRYTAEHKVHSWKLPALSAPTRLFLLFPLSFSLPGSPKHQRGEDRWRRTSPFLLSTCQPHPKVGQCPHFLEGNAGVQKMQEAQLCRLTHLSHSLLFTHDRSPRRASSNRSLQGSTQALCEEERF